MPISPSKGHSGRGPGSSVWMPPPQRLKQLSGAWIANLTPGKPISQHFQRLEPGPRFILLFLGETPSLDRSQEAHPGTNWRKSWAAAVTPENSCCSSGFSLSMKFQLLPRGWKTATQPGLELFLIVITADHTQGAQILCPVLSTSSTL